MNSEHPASELGAELVFGDEPIDDEHLESLRREVAQLRADYAAAAAPEPREDLARLFEPGPETAPAAVVPLRSGISAGRRPVRFTRRLAIAMAAVVGAAGLTTGLAAADVLPGPVQRAVHDVLSHAGVHVPSPGTDDHPTPPTVPSTAATGTTPTDTTPAGGAPGTPPGGSVTPGAAPGVVPGASPSPGGLPGGLPSLPPAPALPTSPVTVPGAGALLPPLSSLPLPLPPVLSPTTTSTKPSGSTTRSPSPTTTQPTSTTAPHLPLPPPPTLPPLTLPHLPPLLP